MALRRLVAAAVAALAVASVAVAQSSIYVTSAPPTISQAPFVVNVFWNSPNAQQNVMAVVDILDSNNGWHGSGSQNIGTSAQGTFGITVTPQPGLVPGTVYTLKVWLVPASVYYANPATAYLSQITQNTQTKVQYPLSMAPAPPAAPARTPAPAPVSGTTTSGAKKTLKYFGTSESCAEFGDSGSNHALVPNPGVVGTNYIYPPTSGSINAFHSTGFNIFRIPIRWERFQNPLGAASLSQTDLNDLTMLVNYITQTLGAYALIDVHNYARYNGNIVTAAQLQQFWSLLAQPFANNQQVLFGLMNEPYNLDTDLWVSIANAGIVGIRSVAPHNIITVPGTRFTGAHSWNQSDSFGRANSVSMLNIVDSSNNFYIEMHQYLDSDYSGTNPACVSATWGSDALTFATGWLRQYGFKGFLGEFGASNQQLCITSLDTMLSYMESNADVWVGWTWWSAGPWWGSYFLSIEPTNSVGQAQLALLNQHIQAQQALMQGV